jgi:signal transduction histidine kinase
MRGGTSFSSFFSPLSPFSPVADGFFPTAPTTVNALRLLGRSTVLPFHPFSLFADPFPPRRAVKKREALNIRFQWQNGGYCLVQVRPIDGGWVGSVTKSVPLFPCLPLPLLTVFFSRSVTAQAEAEETLLDLSREREERAKKEAEEAQEKTKAAVEEKQQQELLIDVTSHEIRNPVRSFSLLLLPCPPTDLPHFSQISAILQNADFTRSSLQSLRKLLLSLKESSSLPPQLDNKILDDLEEDIEALDSITECGLAQERIANDILGLAQIQLSKYSITPVEFDLATSLRNICRMFKVRPSFPSLFFSGLTFLPLFCSLQSECRSKDVELKLVIGSSLARLGPRARVYADPGSSVSLCSSPSSSALLARY